MKKQVVILIAVLCIISMSAAIFVGCDKDASAVIKGVDGVKNIAIDNNAKTIAFDVDCFIDSLSLSNFKVDKGVSVSAYYDEAKTQAIGNELPLKLGENIFFVEASSKKSSTFYKVSVNRELPSSNVDETKTVKSIEVAQAKDTYTVGESYSQGVLKVTYTDGSIDYVTLTSRMVSGFDTSSKGEITLTVTLQGASATYKIKVVDVTLPQYPQVSPAQLDSEVFVDTVCKWCAIILSIEAKSLDYLQEEYDYRYQRTKAELSDYFYKMAPRFANSGLSTELLAKIDKPVTEILKAILDIAFIEYEGDVYENLKKVLDSDIVVRMRDSAKELLDLIEPEYIATLGKNEIDSLLKDFLPEINFDEMAESAEKSGLSEVSQFLKELQEKSDKSVFASLLADYDSMGYVAQTVLDVCDVILGCDIDSIKSAVLCIVDIATMDGDKFGELIAGKGKYSYREIISHANTVGEFITTFADSVISKQTIVKLIANDVMNLLFNYYGGYMPQIEAIVDLSSDFGLFKSIGMFLKNLTVADITDIYMDFNDWQVANNNDVSEEDSNAKFAVLATRVAKLVGKALDYSSDKDNSVKAICNLIKYLDFDFEIAEDTLLLFIDKAASVEDPTKMTKQQALEIYSIFEQSILEKSNSITGGVSAYIKQGATKAEFAQLLQLSESAISNFDSSSTGIHSTVINYDNQTMKIKYFVYSSDTANQMQFDWVGSTGYIGNITFEKNAAAEQVKEEVLNSWFANNGYSYIDPTSMYKIHVSIKNCKNISIVGLDTSKAGRGVAYAVGEHEVMGKQVFPFDYLVLGGGEDEKVLSGYRLSSNQYAYKVGDKFNGSFEAYYNFGNFEYIAIDENNLNYDFSTPGYKVVTYTYQGNKYTCDVRVYSQEYAKEFDSISIMWCSSYNYLKGSAQAFVFSSLQIEIIKDLKSTILDLQGMTVDEVRAEIKKINPDYDIALTGFDTNKEAGEYEFFVVITKFGKTVAAIAEHYIIEDELPYDWLYSGVEIYTADGNTQADSLEDLNVKYIVIDCSYMEIVCTLSDLSKYGELSYRGYWLFTTLDGIEHFVSLAND